MRPRKPTLAAHLLLIAVSLVWGATFPLVKSALEDISPLLFNLLRMALAFAILAALNARVLRRLARPENRAARNKALRFGAIAGLFLGVGYQFQTAGLARTTASKSAFITGLVVVFVPLLGTLPRVRQPNSPKPGPRTFAGAALAFAGLVLLTTPRGAGYAILSGLHLGEWLTLICAVAFAAHLLTLARAGAHSAPHDGVYTELQPNSLHPNSLHPNSLHPKPPADGSLHVSARVLGTLQVGFAALLMLLTLPLGGRPHLLLTPRVLVALAVTAVLATAFAFTVQSWAQQHIPASHTALIVTLEPVFAWLTSLLFLGERLGPRALAGAALILLGILAAELGVGNDSPVDPEPRYPETVQP